MSNAEMGILIEVLKSLVAIFEKQGKHVLLATSAVLERCWQLFDACLPVYEASSILGAGENDEDTYVSTYTGLFLDLKVTTLRHWQGVCTDHFNVAACPKAIF